MPSLHQQRSTLENILTARQKLRRPYIQCRRHENMDASRRVEIKFRLKDAEMIEQMNKILKGE